MNTLGNRTNPSAVEEQISMEPVWSEQYVVRSYDAGASGTLKPQVIFQFLQEAASNHAAHLGAGFDALRSLGLFWALSRIRIEIDRLPAWGESVTLTTWPKGIDRLFALRDFRLLDPRGTTLVRGTSCWLLLDIEKLRPRRIESLERHYLLNDADHALNGTPDKLILPAGLEPKYERFVTASDLDVNHHVNNTEYIRWITDALDPADGSHPPIRSLQVNYLEEAHLGDTLLFSAGKEREGSATMYVEGTNRSTRATIVQARAECRI